MQTNILLLQSYNIKKGEIRLWQKIISDYGKRLLFSLVGEVEQQKIRLYTSTGTID